MDKPKPLQMKVYTPPTWTTTLDEYRSKEYDKVYDVNYCKYTPDPTTAIPTYTTQSPAQEIIDAGIPPLSQFNINITRSKYTEVFPSQEIITSSYTTLSNIYTQLHKARYRETFDNLKSQYLTHYSEITELLQTGHYPSILPIIKVISQINDLVATKKLDD